MLNGRKALILEKEFLIALDLQRVLEGFQVGETLFAHNAAEAGHWHRRWPDIALGLIEIHQDDPPTEALVATLLDAGVPVVLITADTALLQGYSRFPRLPVLIKPVPEPELKAAITAALGNG
jgi:DNA-binding LytR/AlgR family response regulator